MSSQETLQTIIRLFNTAPIKRTTGMALRFNEKGEAIFTQPYNPSFDHALEDTHGGLIATLLDNAGWFTVAAHYNKWVLTVDLNIKLLEPVQKRDLVAIGHLVRAGNKLSTATMEVKSGDGRLIAIGSGTFSVTSKSISDS